MFPLRHCHRTQAIIPDSERPPNAARRTAGLAGAAAAGAKALDLARLGRGNVVRPAPHLAHEPLLLDLASELAQRLLELLGILDDYLQREITSFS